MPTWTAKSIVEQVTAGHLALPEFQRDFVWPTEASVEFLISVTKNYPVGALLFLENTSKPKFKEKPIEGAPIPQAPPKTLILDGQQRVTTLFQALTGVGDAIFYIDVKLWEESGGEDVS